MSGVAYVNGRIVAQQDAMISVFDHGFLYGEGVYEVIRTYDGEPFLLDRHFRRLRASAAMIALDVGMSDDALEGIVRDTMAAYREGAGGAPAGQEVLARILRHARHRRAELRPAGVAAPVARHHRQAAGAAAGRCLRARRGRGARARWSAITRRRSTRSSSRTTC